MSKLTKQGLSGSLLEAMEFGFKAHEHGYSLEQARDEIVPKIKALAETCDNLPREVLRIEFRKGKKTKVTTVQRMRDGALKISEK